MQISSFSLSPSLPLGKTTSTPATQHPVDEAVINFSADSFSGLVKQAGQMPEVRSEVVDAFKARIASGEYPTPDTIDHLTDVIGPGIVKLAGVSAEN